MAKEILEDWSHENKSKPWTDDELRIVLSDAPTRANALKHARGFRRGLGSVTQIYRWALTSKAVINKKRPTDSYVRQVKRVSKEVGWFS